MKTITLTQEQFDLLQDALSTVITSCDEGYEGTWDSGSDEGRDGFLAMKDELNLVAKTLGMEVSQISF
jgi:hypothetical protein